MYIEGVSQEWLTRRTSPGGVNEGKLRRCKMANKYLTQPMIQRLKEAYRSAQLEGADFKFNDKQEIYFKTLVLTPLGEVLGIVAPEFKR